jgi:hypothetical protein
VFKGVRSKSHNERKYSWNTFLYLDCTVIQNIQRALKTKQWKIQTALLKMDKCQTPMAHFCNPSYFRGWDLKDCSSRPVQPNSSWDPISKMYWRCGSSSRIPALQVQNPEFKPQSHTHTKKEQNIWTYISLKKRKIYRWKISTYVIRLLQIKAMRWLYTYPRMVKIQNTNNSKC